MQKQAVLIYLGMAVVLGVVTGLALHLTLAFWMSVLHPLSGRKEESQRTMDLPALENPARKSHQEQASIPRARQPTFPGLRINHHRTGISRRDQLEYDRAHQRKGGLLSQTILEEEDDSD